MWYFTKKEILEHFGKDGKNVRRLDRAIKRWQVVHVNGMYASRHDYDLDRMIKMKTEIKELKEKAEWWDASIIKQLKEDLDYQIKENEKLINNYNALFKRMVSRCYSQMESNKALPVWVFNEMTLWMRMEWKDVTQMQWSHEEKDEWEIKPLW